MRLFAGIDGGQSQTRCVIADERGVLLGRGTAGPADEVGASSDSTRLRDALGDALSAAMRAAHLSPATRVDTVVAGVSGYEGSPRGVRPDLPAQRSVLLHDAPIAHAGAFAARAGIVVIAGTGSVAYGVAASGEAVTVGGWGFLFGDDGSAFAIARETVRAATCAFDDGRLDDALFRAVQAHSGYPSLHGFVRACSDGAVARDAIAALAKTTLVLAEHGDERAAQIARSSAAALAHLAGGAARRLEMIAPEVCFVGGLLANAWFSQQIDAALGAGAPAMRRVAPRYDPAAGALLLAYREAGLQVTEVIG